MSCLDLGKSRRVFMLVRGLSTERMCNLYVRSNVHIKRYKDLDFPALETYRIQLGSSLLVLD